MALVSLSVEAVSFCDGWTRAFSPFLPQLPLLGLRRFISRRRRCSLLSSASSLHRAFPAPQRRGCYCEGPDDNPRRIWKGKDNVNFTLLRRSTFVRGILSKYWASITKTRLKGHPNPSMPCQHSRIRHPLALIGVESCLEELALGSASIYVQRVCILYDIYSAANRTSCRSLYPYPHSVLVRLFQVGGFYKWMNDTRL